ncbi:MAG: TIGR02594 family protein [Hyphomicrobium sp.]
MTQPAWLAAAWAEFGVREGRSAANTARVVGYYKDAGHGRVANDDVPWCAAFVGAMLARCAIAPTGSLMARSYAGWGRALAAPQLGAICVLSRGADPALGHVGFYVGEDGRRVFLLGGNQDDAVSVAAYDRSRVLALRWPDTNADRDAAPLTQHTPELRHDAFDAALAHVLAMEGGFSDDPNDPGGPTQRGITLAVYAAWIGRTIDATSRADLVAALKAIPEATVRAIYAARYWRPARCGELNAALALMHFDAAVNHGVGAAARMVQQALGVTVDGEIGPDTLAAAARADIAKTIARYGDIRRARYRALPHFWRFGRGWLRRTDSTVARALEMAAAFAKTSTNEKGRTMTNDVTRTNEGSGNDDATSHVAGKWWLQSKTVWGSLIAAAAAIAPALGPLFGIDIPAAIITDIGQQTLVTVQAIAGLAGTLLAIYGRLRAVAPLTRRDVRMRL